MLLVLLPFVWMNGIYGILCIDLLSNKENWPTKFCLMLVIKLCYWLYLNAFLCGSLYIYMYVYTHIYIQKFGMNMLFYFFYIIGWLYFKYYAFYNRCTKVWTCKSSIKQISSSWQCKRWQRQISNRHFPHEHQWVVCYHHYDNLCTNCYFHKLIDYTTANNIHSI